MLLPEGAKETTYSVNGNTSLELDGQYRVQHWKEGAIQVLPVLWEGEPTEQILRLP